MLAGSARAGRLVQEGPARGPALRPWGAPVRTPNLPEAELHPDAEGVSDSWSGSPPGSGSCAVLFVLRQNHELPHARRSSQI